MTDEGEGQRPVQVTPGQAAVAIVSVVAGLVLMAWIMGEVGVTVSQGGSEGGSAAAPAPEPEPEPEPVTDLRVHGVECSESVEIVTAAGSVRNHGETTANFVTVELRFRDSAGEVIDTDTTYAVGSEHLRPGESSQWRGHSRAAGVARCEAEIHDWRVVE